jgi:hypothetical protein
MNTFETKLNKLQTFYAIHGEMPKREEPFRENEGELLKFVDRCRKNKFRNSENDIRLEMSFPSWSWNPSHDRFMANFEMLQTFYAVHGMPTPLGTRENEFYMYKFVAKCRKDRNEGRNIEFVQIMSDHFDWF